MAQHRDVGERVEEHLLVIAGEQRAPRRSRLPGARPRDHAGAVGTAVDQVAEQAPRWFGRRRARIVALDRVDQRLEQIEPAVDVADRVPARARAGTAGSGAVWAARWRERNMLAKGLEHQGGSRIGERAMRGNPDAALNRRMLVHESPHTASRATRELAFFSCAVQHERGKKVAHLPVRRSA